jgi:hypothetical protein
MKEPLYPDDERWNNCGEQDLSGNVYITDTPMVVFLA